MVLARQEAQIKMSRGGVNSGFVMTAITNPQICG